MTYSLGIHYGATFGRHKKIRKKLIANFGKCYWCNLPVREYTSDEHRLFTLTQVYPKDVATLDHLKSRYAGRKKHEITPKVLCCYHCNQQRAKDDQKKFRNSDIS